MEDMITIGLMVVKECKSEVDQKNSVNGTGRSLPRPDLYIIGISQV